MQTIMRELSVKEKIDALPEKAKDILEAAIPVFAEKGYHDTTVEDIAQKAGVAKGTVYLYFANKEDLFIHLVLFVSHKINEAIRKKITKVEDTLQKLNIAMDIHFATLLKFKSHYLVAESGSVRFFTEEEAFRQAKIEHIKMYEDILAEHFRRLRVAPPFSLKVASLIIAGGLTTYARFHFLKDFAPPAEEYLSAFKKFVHRALLPQDSPGKLSKSRRKAER